MATGEILEKKEEHSNRIAKKVLFVRNLSYNTTDEEFEKTFSDIGPLRRSYLIKNKGQSRVAPNSCTHVAMCL
jgi:RNA recognition motif-containing protein